MQVLNTQQAITDLEAVLGFNIQGYAEGTTTVPDRLAIDQKKLQKYLNWVLKIHAKGNFRQHISVIDYFGAFSNTPRIF